MGLTLRLRKLNHVVVLDCSGRIVAGPDAAALENEARKCIGNQSNLIINLSGVEFVDSSGLGLLVRLATSARNTPAGIRFCSPMPAVQKVIAMTLLDRVLQLYETEEQALTSFNKRQFAAPASGPGDILCADDSPDLLAYLREGLGRAGYRVQSASIIPDAVLLLKAMRPRLLIAGPRFADKLSPRATEMNIPVLRLADDFCTADAGQALAGLLTELGSRLA